MLPLGIAKVNVSLGLEADSDSARVNVPIDRRKFAPVTSDLLFDFRAENFLYNFIRARNRSN